MCSCQRLDAEATSASMGVRAVERGGVDGRSAGLTSPRRDAGKKGSPSPPSPPADRSPRCLLPRDLARDRGAARQGRDTDDWPSRGTTEARGTDPRTFHLRAPKPTHARRAGPRLKTCQHHIRDDPCSNRSLAVPVAASNVPVIVTAERRGQERSPNHSRELRPPPEAVVK